MSVRIGHEDLLAFVRMLFRAEGVPDQAAAAMAEGFVEAELLGYRSHGVVKVATNLAWLRGGQTRKTGMPAQLVDRPAIASWDGRELPGHWVMRLALDHAMDRARHAGTFTMTIRRCQHVACLAATLMPAVAARMIVLMMVSSPDEAYVSPFGGSRRVFSNNPLAFTAPVQAAAGPAAEPAAVLRAPILFDVSMAITAGSQAARAARLGRPLGEAAIKDSAGRPSADPAALAEGGSVMPIGGTGHGHKGHALTIMTEVLTQALAGHGRAGRREQSELNNVYLQVIDPGAFSATEDYDREMAHLCALVTGSQPDDPALPVRMPGQRAWQRRAGQMANGVTLDAGVWEMLEPFAADCGLPMPALRENL